MDSENNIVSNIIEGSIAEEVGIEQGDKIVSINGRNVVDIIDYFFLISDEYLEVEVEKPDGEIWVYEIDKDFDEELGIEFGNPILDCAMSCRNKCIFCFIDQMPKGMRKSLYFKDDDSRLSFLQGNFVTLTNLNDNDINRIIEYNISPINVSIHTTNPELRVNMLNNKFASNIMERLKKLIDGRIQINGQIVLCPGYNDGDELVRTVRELFEFGEGINSLAIVPIGITKFREELTFIEPVDLSVARRTISDISLLQNEFLNIRGDRFVFLSDEFYLKGEIPFPEYDEYEGFVQLENGVGLIKKMEKEILEYLEECKYGSLDDKTVSIATGTLSYEFIKKMSKAIENKISSIKINVYFIKNDFFGETITVAGLVTGGDILSQLEGKSLGSKLFIPKVMLKAEEDIFLDDMTVSFLEKKLNIDIESVKNDGYEFVEKILF